LILNKDVPIFIGKFVFVAVATSAIDGKGPPIIVAVVESIIILLFLPFLKLSVLLEA
jgi:hypothetical protein